MDMRSIYIANGVGIFILLMLQYTSRTKIQRSRPEDRIYSFMVIGVMLGCAMEAFSYTLDGRVFPGARALNYAANTCLYTIIIAVAGCQRYNGQNQKQSFYFFHNPYLFN